MAAGKMPTVAIVGRPNVGKSALFNRLAGRRIAIVHDQPGITRDRLLATCALGDPPFRIFDTGGIMGAGETEMMNDVRTAAGTAMDESELALFVVDGKHGMSPMDQDVAIELRKRGKPVILVINKIDDPKHDDRVADFASLGFARSVAVSAAHGRQIGELVEAITEVLPVCRASVSDAESEGGVSQTRPTDEKESRAIRLAFVGRPNAGKSSLVNAILQAPRTIVSEIPGTTRDSVDIQYERDGEEFVIVDTAGIRRRGKHSTSVEVFSVMRAEKSIERADICVLVIDAATGVLAQDRKIAGLIQKARKACVIVLNKWDLVKPQRAVRDAIELHTERALQELFFLPYAQVLIASAKSGEHVERIFRLLERIRGAAKMHIGTGILNRALRAAVDANPPPMVSGRRLKLLYAAQSQTRTHHAIEAPEFVLFVNDDKLLPDPYRRYLEAKIREIKPYPSLPLILTLRPRADRST